MDATQLDQLHVLDGRVSQAAQAGQLPAAEQTARLALSNSQSDLGVTLLLQNKTEQAIQTLQDALNTCPSNLLAFHNLVAGLMSRQMLRGNNLDTMARFVADNYREFPWLDKYRPLLFLPTFLNLQFVRGKCNLRCRMCRGTNGPDHPGKLSHILAEDFDRLLAAAPTVAGVTLSSGDSDPLLHPQFDTILEIAARHKVSLDIFTNGHALSARLCRRMVESKAVGMINFSIDAATEETYRRIRGASFSQVTRKIEMLEAMKKEVGTVRPGLSLSFVAMSDNIQDLPAFVAMGLRFNAYRVFVEYLNGWDGPDDINLVPTRNPECFRYVREAQQLAAGHTMILSLPDRLLAEMARSAKTSESSQSVHSPAEIPASPPMPRAPEVGVPVASAATNTSVRHECCGWLRGLWVQEDGTIDPCCLVHRVANMGNVHDGPLYRNPRFGRVKNLLMAGKVFPECLETRMCQYVQQQLAAGHTPPLITADELGETCRPGHPQPTDQPLELQPA